MVEIGYRVEVKQGNDADTSQKSDKGFHYKKEAYQFFSNKTGKKGTDAE
jgi:hypothetical protein